MDNYDVIVVGGGSAGSIVAAELSADPDKRVLVLEGGPDAETFPETLSADGYKTAFINDELLYERFSVARPEWGHRPIYVGTGRGLGGSGSVNGMVYTRGDKRDFALWPEGWRWDDVVPHFEELEKTIQPEPQPPTRWTEAAIAAAETQGVNRSENLNDGNLGDVLGYEHMNRGEGLRRSSYATFLKPVRGRRNLTVKTSARVHRIRFGTNGVDSVPPTNDGRKAGGPKRPVAVEYEVHGELLEARLAPGGEVVMAAGSLETPVILLRSGIGPQPQLRRHGIPTVADLPQIGENLHDHPNAPLFFRGKQPVDCSLPQLYGFARVGEGKTRDGEGKDIQLEPGQSDACLVFYPARSSFREGLIKLLPGIILPEKIRTPRLRSLVREGVARAFAAPPIHRFVENLWGIVVILGKPKSRGHVRLTSADPHAPAEIDPAYLKEEEDLETMLSGMEVAERVAASAPFRAFYAGGLSPGALGNLPGPLRRAARIAWLKTNLMTTYHFAGTVRMGHDLSAPVDPDTLELRGVAGVRIADASVMPFTPVSALNAPSMMIGLRAAKVMMGR